MKKIKGIEEANGFIQQPVLTNRLPKGHSVDGKSGLELHSSTPAGREPKQGPWALKPFQRNSFSFFNNYFMGPGKCCCSLHRVPSSSEDGDIKPFGFFAYGQHFTINLLAMDRCISAFNVGEGKEDLLRS